MKKCIIAIFLAVVMLTAFGCTKEDKGSEAKNNTMKETTVGIKSDNMPDVMTEIPTQDLYSEALTEDEIAEITELAEKWYSENFAEYELISIESETEAYYTESHARGFDPGEIIIFKVKTTKEGEDDRYRHCVFVKDESGEWQFKTEGY